MIDATPIDRGGSDIWCTSIVYIMSSPTWNQWRTSYYLLGDHLPDYFLVTVTPSLLEGMKQQSNQSIKVWKNNFKTFSSHLTPMIWSRFNGFQMGKASLLVLSIIYLLCMVLLSGVMCCSFKLVTKFTRRRCIRHVVVAAAAAKTACPGDCYGPCSCGMLRLFVVSLGV